MFDHVYPISDVTVGESNSESKLPVLQTATAIAMSMIICKASTYISKLLGIQGGNLPIITASVVVLATLLPQQFAYLAPAGDAIAVVLLQVNIGSTQEVSSGSIATNCTTT